MQSFSPAPDPAEAVQQLLSIAGAARVIAFCAGTIVVGILANWVASLCVARERATLGRAATSYLLSMGFEVVLMLVFVALTPYVLRNSGTPGALSLLVAIVCGSIAAALGVPMRIYRMSGLRTLGSFA